jgi:hypothetical protein
MPERGRLRQEPLCLLNQCTADCIGFTSERWLRLLTLKRPFREAACSVRRRAVAFAAGGYWAGRVGSSLPLTSSAPTCTMSVQMLFACATCVYAQGIIQNFDAPGISPR